MCAAEPQVQGNIAQCGMLIDQHAFLLVPPDEMQGQMQRQRTHPGPALSADQRHNSARLRVLVPDVPSSGNVRQSLRYTLRIERFDQELRAPAAHGGNDALRNGTAARSDEVEGFVAVVA